MFNKSIFWVSSFTAIILALSSCGDAEDWKHENQAQPATEHDKEWWSLIGGVADSKQIWTTSSRVKATVHTGDSAIVSAYTLGQETRKLFFRKQIVGEEVIAFDVPQTDAEYIAFECDYGYDKVFRRAELKVGNLDKLSIDFAPVAATRAATRAINGVEKESDKAYLTDPTPRGSLGYSSWPGWTWDDLNTALPEEKEPVKGESVRDYELISNGPFYISLLYGGTGNFRKRTLGYYYYKESGNYSDFQMVYLTETLYYDYIDGLSKVQYQLDNQDTWYDANFDVFDGNESLGMVCPIAGRQSYSKQTQRRNDEVYNTIILNNYYKERISGIRGITFKVDVPVGYRLGFFLEGGENNHAADDSKELSQPQRDKLLGLGIPASALPEKPYYTCFANNAFNYGGKKFRSVIRRYNGYTFMGMEDTVNSTGSTDSNDICFGLMAGNGGTMPGVVLPGVYDVEKKQYYNQDGTWTDVPLDYDPETHTARVPEGAVVDPTGQYEVDYPGMYIAYEDKGEEGDFDFNDVIIHVVTTTAHRARVYLSATGGTYPAKIYYDGPNGIQLLCSDVHKTIGGTYVNVGKGSSAAEVYIATVDWPESYSMTTDAYRFFLLVQGKRISVNQVPGTTPNAFCVSDEWCWPVEKTNVTTAYPLLGNWAKNASDQSYWNWYQHPLEEHIVADK